MISFASISSAQLDYNASALAVSFPLGAQTKFDLGYGVKVWGDPAPWYGYVRPSVAITTSGVINSFSAQIDVFPISFLGAYAGTKHSQRDTDDLDTFDCTQVVCDGKLQRDYFGVKLGLELFNFYLFADYKKENINLDENPLSQNIADETTSLVALEDDTSENLLGILGYKLDENWSLGVMAINSEIESSSQTTSYAFLFGLYDLKPWQFTLSAGEFTARDDEKHFTVLGQITWNGESGVKLF